MKEMGTPRERMIDRGIQLEKVIKESKRELDGIKAVIQAEALRQMENTNTKHIQYFGKEGSVKITYKEKFEVDNITLLQSLVGGLLFDTNIKIETSCKATVSSRLKKALITLYKGDYGEHDIAKLLLFMGLCEKQAKLALKKLKGEYFNDKKVLENFGLDGEFEEELDAIREQKNFDAASKFFDDLQAVSIEKLKRAIAVEDSLAIGFEFDEGEEKNEDD